MPAADRTTTTARRWAVGGALAALLAAAGCGGDGADTPGAAATTSAAPAATTPGGGATGPGAGGADCAGLLQAATDTTTKVGEAGTDPAKAAAALTEGAAAVRKEADALGGAAGEAGRKAATDIAAAGKALQDAEPGDPLAYVTATKALVESILPLARACGVDQDG